MQNQHPIWLWIDPSRACNLACAFCYSKQSHADEHLSLNDFRFFLDTFMTSTNIVIQKMHLNWRGDPLMNPQLPQLLEELESRHPYFPFEFHTNGTLMTESIASELATVMRHGELYVSIDGGTERGHDLNRGPGTFRLALGAIRMLLRARGSRMRPRLGIFQLDIGEPESLYDHEFLEVAGEVDDWVRVDPVHPRSGQRVKVHRNTKPTPLAGVPDSSKDLPVIQPQDRWWTLELPPDSSIPFGPCFWAGNALFVAPSGDVSVCLLSHTADGILGNLHRDSLEQIVAAAAAFRARITTLGRAAISHCSRCRMAVGFPDVTIASAPAPGLLGQALQN